MTLSSERLGYIDQRGVVQIGFKYYYGRGFSNGLAAVLATRDGLWGYIDKTGQFAIAPQFDQASDFRDGIAMVRKGGAIFFINEAGDKVLESELELLGFVEGFSPAKRNGKWGFVNIRGQTVIPFKYQSANVFSEGLACVVFAGKLGYVDRSGKVVIEAEFDPMSNLSRKLPVNGTVLN